MMDTEQEFWTVIETGDAAEWGVLARCAALSGNAAVALIREGLSPAAACAHGARKVYLLQGEITPYQAGCQIAHLAKKHTPSAIFFSANARGRPIAATVAAILNTGLAADCTHISRNPDGLLVMTRPALGDSMIADILCPLARPQMATVRPGMYLPEEKDAASYTCDAICVPAPKEAPGVILLEKVVQENAELFQAQIIIAGGRGVGSREGFAMLGRLASTMGAALGASRGAVNAGYASYRQQIGLTGRTVRPAVYMAFGISGAVQHIVGMDKSGIVLAVDTDPAAPIFEYSDYGIVGDWRHVCENLIRLFSHA